MLLHLWLLPAAVVASLDCRPEGPVLPKPSQIAKSPVFAATARNVTHSLDAVLSGNIHVGWPVNNLSFSLSVVSLDQKDPGIPLWEYHHLAESNVNGTKHVDRNSQYLIGSISKVISDYILLRSGVDVNSPVTRFLPQLSNTTSLISWQNVTLGMLASHLGGVAANTGFSEYYYLQDVFTGYGFPNINDSSYPSCGVIGLNHDCSEQAFIDSLKHIYPLTAPMERPAYSNVAFNVLMLALKKATGRNFTQLVDEMVSQPFGMHDTYPSPGDDKKGVIPYGDSNWGTDFAYSAPNGGLVSTTADLSRFTHGLLSRSLGLTPAQTRQWLKPASFAGGPDSFSGLPWEIFRSSSLVPQHPHPVTVYGKNGGNLQYHSQISVVDEYGIAIVVLTAGPMQAQPVLTNYMLHMFVPMSDEVSRREADAQYCRTFASSPLAAGAIGGGVNITLEQDEDSMVISSFFRGGADILTALPEIWNLTFGQYTSPFGSTVRLFPTELTINKTMNQTHLTGDVWRLWPEVLPSAKSDLPGADLGKADCTAWTTEDWVYYGGEPTDRVIFYKDTTGSVVGFEAPFLRSGFMKPVR